MRNEKNDSEEPLKDRTENQSRTEKKKDGGLLGKMTRKPLNLSIPQLIKHDGDCTHKEQKPL